MTKLMGPNCGIKYVYAPTGRKLRASHSQSKRVGRTWQAIASEQKDYIGNLIRVNCIPAMYRFPGGYYSFSDSGLLADCHYYVQDYQGNNRMVVSKGDAIEQVTHYLPYGVVLNDINTNSSLQDFKFGGKELDRSYGLDLYDFEARQYDPIVPAFNSIDPLAEKYYGISPYAYCAGDPVNCVDPTGMKPDSLEAAYMADHVYNNSGKLIGGWSCSTYGSTPNGLQYGIYKKETDGTTEYTIAFAGTDVNDKQDLKTDYNQAVGNLGTSEKLSESQYGTGIKIANAALMITSKNGNELTLVGHSLGGGIAALAALDTGLPAITFSPAGVHDNTIEAAGLSGIVNQDITNYCVQGEILGPVNNMTGTSTLGNTVYLSGGKGSPIARHSMNEHIRLLSK